MATFQQALNLHQERWREAHGHPIGTQPIVPRPGGPKPRAIGARIPLEYARQTGANFISPTARDAAAARLAAKESNQSLDHQRLWVDLASSVALCFNLFGDLAADLRLADRALHRLWTDVPGTVCQVRFQHSPGWLDPGYLGNLVAFDVAFVLDLGGGQRGILGVETRYQERPERREPKPERLTRYLEVAERSRLFTPEAIAAVNGTDLLVMWLEHLLVQSMLQHPSDTWRWGRLVYLHPSINRGFADACARYRSLLRDPSSFAPMTIEDVLDSGALPSTTAAAVRERYIP